jgi:hypothetical protein
MIMYLLRIPNPRIIIPIMSIVAWQYALLMQIPDALAWRDPKADYPGKMAFFLNTTQPFMVLFCVGIILYKLNMSLICLLPALLIGIVYLVYIIISTTKVSFDITPKESCTSLNYSWWNTIPILLYVAVIVASALSIPSIPFSSLMLFLMAITVFISSKIVNKSCNYGSMWCWSVASAGLITTIFTLLLQYGKVDKF